MAVGSIYILMSIEPRATTRMSSRHRPLHSCGVSILAIVHSAYTKAQEFNGLIGSTARKVAKLAPFAGPLAYAMQYHWLTILSFADDQILAVENMIEKVFPPSNHVFNKIDYLVQVAETLPEKFDTSIQKKTNKEKKLYIYIYLNLRFDRGICGMYW
ncbi:hypothetical protein CFP56_006256 [Quercus suber]|uniref:Uncharacterized protein n=1 Tax=Quercus suber TaxID=58331 RepID=A0AAW0LAP5_QUESU